MLPVLESKCLMTNNKTPSPIIVFEYQPRPCCICGSSLEAAPSDVIKETVCGNVYFARCSVCGSYSQSPQITTESLSKWYDSDEYQGGSGQTGSAYVNYEQDEQARVHEARGRFRKHIAPFLPKNPTCWKSAALPAALFLSSGDMAIKPWESTFRRALPGRRGAYMG